ncbi:MAG TPA: MFS transporter [Thermodesulfobacteriota bacterium]|nr:MFS transporter [Thermodesulfobacteriota bacterium]
MTAQKILTRDFVLNFLAQFAFSFVSFILVPTIPVYLSRFEAKAGEIGFLIGILSVFSLIPRPFIGRALLRIPERKFMIAGAVLYILSSVAYLLAPPFWPFLIVRIMQGVGLAFFSTASVALIANITSENRRGQIISYYFLSFNFAFALAPYFGMVLINQFSFTVLFWACAALSLCTLFVSLKLRKMHGIPIENESIQSQPFFSREVLPSAIMAFLLNVIWGSLGAFFPLYALRHGVSNPGIYFAFVAITLILSRSLGGRILDIYAREQVIVPCFIAIIISIVVLTFSTTLQMFILVAIIFGTGWAFLYPSLVVYAVENSGSARGPAMGTFTALADLGAGIGPMIIGLILEWTNYQMMFIFLALIGAVNFLYFGYAIRKKRKKGRLNDG